MITPSHIIYSWALAKVTEKSVKSQKTGLYRRRTLAFVLGAVFPDTITWVFFIVCGLILGYSAQTMWGDMYFNSAWSIPITLAHSFWLWPSIIALSSYFGLRFLKWFSISALFHSLIDFFVHTDDAYRHFWPFSDFKFHSPISYYNPNEYGLYVSTFDSLLVLGLLTYLYTKYTGRWRYVIVMTALFYIIRLLAEPMLITFMDHGN